MRTLARLSAGLLAIAGTWIGLGTAVFYLFWQDIDGPVPIAGRLIGALIGAAILGATALSVRGLLRYSRRPSAPATNAR